MADFYLKQNNTARPFVAVLRDDEGPVDLTGATVLFVMQQSGESEPKVSAAAAVDPDQTANKGKVTYAWVSVDVDTAGTFLAEWVVTFDGGGVQSFPNEGQLVVEITPALGAGATVYQKTQAEKDLEAVRAALVPATSTGVQEYEIGGVGTNRRIRYYGKTELLELETALAQRVNAERRRAKQRKGAPAFKRVY
jgi:hypothetical protein